jgi:hypothetical protein
MEVAFMTDQDLLWKNIPCAKYGDSVECDPDIALKSKLIFSSVCWKDLCALGKVRGLSTIGLSGIISRRVGYGRSFFFLG